MSKGQEAGQLLGVGSLGPLHPLEVLLACLLASLDDVKRSVPKRSTRRVCG